MSNVLKDEYDEHFALIIGIDEYENLNHLEHAVNDAKAMYNILIDKYNYKKENVTMLLNKEATKQNIMDNFYDFTNKTCPNDSVIIFFAGHGSTFPTIKKDKGFLIPCDGSEINMNTLVSWDVLIGESDVIKAKHIFFIMDACYSGLALVRSGVSKRFLKDMLRRQARQVLTAGKADQRVKDVGNNTSNSIFTEYLLEALNGAARTEEGIISASSVMNYVYNRVANDPNSNQTPGYGTLLGEGDFIFNSEEFVKEKDSDKDNDFLIEVDDRRDEQNLFHEYNVIKEIKNLLSDNKNFIKITELVNEEIRIYLRKISEYEEINVNDSEEFVVMIKKYQDDIGTLLRMLILLTYYGEERYLNLILKIISKIVPNNTNNSFLYYSLYLAFYVVIITSIEGRNFEVLKSVLNFKKSKTINYNMYFDDNYLLINTIDKMLGNVSEFRAFFPNKNYKYPFSEYIYKELQPLIDDLLYVGDEYPELFISTEILISVFFAIQNYSENSLFVWGPLGRYTYQMLYSSNNLEKFPINKIIEKIGVYSDLNNKEDFVSKYNEFLSKNRF